MKNQIKIVLLALTLLSSAVFSSKLSNKSLLKAKNELNAKVESKVELKHDEGNHEPEPCELDPNYNGVLGNLPPVVIPTPRIVDNARDPLQVKDHEWTRIDETSNNCPQFHDLGVNSEGFIVAIGANGLLYQYNFDLDTFTEIEGDFHLNRLRRVDIGYDGYIYVVNRSGDTYYLNCNGEWIKLPGCAIDIGTGRGDEVAKIGCNDICETLTPDIACVLSTIDDIETSSPHMYKLHCDCECTCCRKRCNRFLKKDIASCNCDDKDKKNDRKCYWIKYPYGPVWDDNNVYKPCLFERIDVNSNGYPMVTAKCGLRSKIYQFTGGDLNVYNQVLDVAYSLKVKDLCGDNLGNIFYIQDEKVYVYNNLNGDIQVLTPNFTPGNNISCGPYAQPTVTSDECCMYTTTKVGYN